MEVEEIPLDDFSPTPIVAPAPAAGGGGGGENTLHDPNQGSIQLAAYKTQMANLIEKMRNILLPSPHWQVITSPSPIVLYEQPSVSSEWYALKAVAVVSGRASRYNHVIKDHDPFTRMPWDKDNVAMVQQMETYKAEEGDITVVQSTWKSRHPRLFADRHVLGIMHCNYDAELSTYTIYFTTASHYHFKSPVDNHAKADAEVCIVLRRLEKELTEITLVIRANPNVSTWAFLSLLHLNAYKEEVRMRIGLYERVVLAWNDFYGKRNDPKKVENRR